MSRSYARESAFKLVFEYLFTKEKDEEALQIFLDDQNNKNEEGYLQEIYNGVINHYDELIEDIKSVSASFKIDRIFKVDLAILLIAIYEMKNNVVPKKVSISEALNIAKVYSTEKSSAYINGILSNFIGEWCKI